jgi:hypothetical protein
MAAQFFMRVRGRVLGPYDQDKMQALAKRGQLSRMHELSSDGISWVRASTFPDLFISDPAEFPALASQAAAVQAAASAAQSAAPTQQTWYYSIAGAEHGPVDFTNLQLLASTGSIGPDDQVWTTGMTTWSPASHIPGLFGVVGKGAGGQAGGNLAGKDSLPLGLCKAATSVRPWVTFIAVMAFVYTVLSTVGGVFLAIVGARARAAPVVATGLFSIIYGVMALVSGYLLLNYANRLSGLNHSRNPIVLEKALDALRGVWIYTSIILIVMLAFTIAVAVWVIAISGTFPWYPL